MKLRRVLYIEGNTDGTVGGSHFCLLALIKNLNKEKYFPTVVFYQTNRLFPFFEDAGAKIILMHKWKKLNLVRSFPRLSDFNMSLITRFVVYYPLICIQKAMNYFIDFVIPTFLCCYILLKEKIDIVHLNNTLLYPQEWIAASIFTKSIVVAHERGINDYFPLQSRFWASFLKRLVCISEVVKKNLLQHGFPESKLFLNYDGIDLSRFEFIVPQNEVLEEFGIPAGTPIIGIVGNVKEWKGQEVVVKAMPRVREKFPTVKCFIVGALSDREGDKSYLDRLRKFVAENKLHDCVIFTGARDDVPSLINAMDILIHASIFPEPFGIVNLEGMALSKPIISTNIGAGPEIIEDGVTGLIVKPGDAEVLADAVMVLLRKPDKARVMGRAGRARLEKYFHLSINTRKTEELYTGILN